MLMRLPLAEGLGRHIEHDERSRAFAVQGAEAPDNVIWPHYGVVLNQGDRGSCTGNAMAHALMVAPLRQRGRSMSQKKALGLYGRATELDPWAGTYPPDDTGSSGLAVCKAAQESGYIARYEWAFGIDHTRRALGQGPVMVGTAWYESMFEPDPSGTVETAGSMVGGHEYVCLGFVDDRYLFLNSWGRSWGVPSPTVTGGCFWMHHATFADLLDDYGDVVQPIG